MENKNYVIAKLACGCAVMQREETNKGLFFLLTHRLERGITLSCPYIGHGRQVVEKLITRTQKRPHWPLFGSMNCRSCDKIIEVPPAAARDDEQTTTGDCVYVRCPDCGSWGNYGYAGSGENYYDQKTVRVSCPNCRDDTVITYDPSTTPTGTPVGPYKCINCKQEFKLIYKEVSVQ